MFELKISNPVSRQIDRSESVDYARRAMIECGYAILSAQDFTESGIDATALAAFKDSWNRLGPDRFMADGGAYRWRRFGKFTLDATGDVPTLEYFPGCGFYQSKAVNALNGGALRTFDELEQETAANSVLRALILDDLQRLPLSGYVKRWQIMIHQIRIVASAEAQGLPTPEGIHRDGHLYVAQHLINRHAVQGGVSRLYDQDRRELQSLVLKDSLDTILLDDVRLMHSVDAIAPLHDDVTGTRDMLLIDFNFQ